jgi:hypothetical protein
MTPEAAIFKAKVNGALALIFIASFTLGISLVVWNAAFGQNPVANAMAAYVVSEQTSQ